MSRYRVRTLLIVLALGPPALAIASLAGSVIPVVIVLIGWLTLLTRYALFPERSMIESVAVPRITIRELLLVTLVVAMGLGSWLDRRSNAVDSAEFAALKDWRRDVSAACEREGIEIQFRGIRRGYDLRLP